LRIEAGGSMAGCIEDLFAQCLWDFERLKGLNCSPMEKRFKDFGHGQAPMLLFTTFACCTRNIKMQTTRVSL
jgi:hypothetical protein